MNLTFYIKNPRDLFELLLKDYEDYQKDKLSVRKALNCVFKCWHLIDWISEYKGLDLFELRKNILDECSELGIMHDICNGLKHYKITRPKSDIDDSILHEGTFDSTFDSTFDISSLQLISENGDKYNLDSVINNVIDYWTEYFNHFSEN